VPVRPLGHLGVQASAREEMEKLGSGEKRGGTSNSKTPNVEKVRKEPG